MDKFFVLLNENLRRKYYPDGFFSYLRKSRKGMRNCLLPVLGIFLIFFSCCTLLGLWLVITNLHDKDIMIPVILDLIGISVCVMLILVMRWLLRVGKMSEEDWIKEMAKANHYPESDIREFGSQAVAADAYILHLDGKLKNNADTGLLTRDYIFFGIYSLLKISDITLACFTEDSDTNMVSTGGHSVTTTFCELRIALLSNKKNLARKKATRESGHVLMKVLKERNPDIEIREEGITKMKELEAMCKA